MPSTALLTSFASPPVWRPSGDEAGLARRGAPRGHSHSTPRRIGDERARPRATARLPAAGPDRDGRTGAAPRPLEPARRLRHGRARPPALGGAVAVRVQRVRLSDRDPAARPGADAPLAPVDALFVRALGASV